jgi:hypothetical protein
VSALSESCEWCTQMSDKQRPPWAARLQRERETRGWNKREMARRLLKATDHQYGSVDSLSRQIRGWEAGEHFPRDWSSAYAAAFDVDEAELLAGNENSSEQAPTAAVLAELLPDGDLTARIATIAGGRTGREMAADLSARAHALRRADDVLAGGDLLGPAFRELEAAVRVHCESTHNEDVNRALLTIIGEMAQIAGWIASDAGQHGRAADTYRLGISAAQEAGDGTLESNLVGSLAYQMTNVGDPAEAVSVAQAAVDAAGSSAPPLSPAEPRTATQPANMNRPRIAATVRPMILPTSRLGRCGGMGW